MILSFVVECHDCWREDYGNLAINPASATITYGITVLRLHRGLVANCPFCNRILGLRDIRSGSGVYNGESITDEQLAWLLQNINPDKHYPGVDCMTEQEFIKALEKILVKMCIDKEQKDKNEKATG